MGAKVSKQEYFSMISFSFFHNYSNLEITKIKFYTCCILYQTTYKYTQISQCIELSEM